MPLHDWTHVPAGLFHHFHQDWSIEIARTLNRGLLPQGTVALVEQRSGPREPDVLAIKTEMPSPRLGVDTGGGVAIQEPPVTTFMQKTDRAAYAARANRIVVRHHLGRIIAVIEIISPGNKDSRNALHRLVEKSVDFLLDGIHVLVVDLFPPTPRDPLGIHKLIWDEFNENASFAFPPGKDRTVASYEAGIYWAAYVESVAVGDPLPDMPLFLTRDLTPNLHIKVPLENTYEATWQSLPGELRVAVETGDLPDPDADQET